MSHSCWFRSATVSLRLATFRLPRKGSMEMIAVAFGCFALASRLSRMACSSVLLGSELLKKHILAAIVGSSRRSSKHTRGISNYNNHVSNIWSIYIYIYISCTFISSCPAPHQSDDEEISAASNEPRRC